MSVLALDVGGSAIKAGLVDQGGRLLMRREVPVVYDRQGAMLHAMHAAVRQLLAAGAQPEGIAISATGQIDAVSGAVSGTCGNLPDWVGTELARTFEAAYGLPVSALNDATCALLGECWVGRARGLADVVLVTLGTGVGGGVLTGGRVLLGPLGYAGEIGHMITHHGGRPCTCGLRGCYEQYASVTALLRAAEAVCPGEMPTGRAVFARAAEGDARALALIAAWTEDIAAGLVGLVHLFSPEIVLIGGGVSGQEALLIAPLRAAVRAGVMPRFADRLEIAAAACGNDAGMLGAARH